MKILNISFPEKCIGCELCIFEAQRQLQKVGIEESLIRVFRDDSGIKFLIDMDPRINNLDINKIKRICPTGVFEIKEESENAINNGF